MFSDFLRALFIVLMLYAVINIIIKLDNIRNRILLWFIITMMAVMYVNNFFIKNGWIEFVIALVAFALLYVPLIFMAIKKKSFSCYVYNFNKSEELIFEFVENYKKENNLADDGIVYQVNHPFTLTFNNLKYKEISKFNKGLNKLIESKTSKNYFLFYVLLVLTVAISISLFF